MMISNFEWKIMVLKEIEVLQIDEMDELTERFFK